MPLAKIAVPMPTVPPVLPVVIIPPPLVQQVHTPQEQLRVLHVVPLPTVLPVPPVVTTPPLPAPLVRTALGLRVACFLLPYRTGTVVVMTVDLGLSIAADQDPKNHLQAPTETPIHHPVRETILLWVACMTISVVIPTGKTATRTALLLMVLKNWLLWPNMVRSRSGMSVQ